MSSEAILVAVLAPLCFSFQTHLEYSSELLMVNSFLTLAVFETHVQLNELILSLIRGDIIVDSTKIYILCWVISSSLCHIWRAKISKNNAIFSNPITKLLLLFFFLYYLVAVYRSNKLNIKKKKGFFNSILS